MGLFGVSLARSGTDALRQLVGSLRGDRPYVGISAYTCPDLFSAVNAAGRKAVLFDIDPVTLLPRPDSVPDHVRGQLGAVILSNLYGLVDPTDAWADFSSTQLIDDGCQAALGDAAGVMIGARGVGVVSFGRGKAFSGVGGGAVIGGTHSEASLGSEGFGVADLLRGVTMWALENPRLYGIPASLPFLGLGETQVHLNVPSGRPSAVQLRYASYQLAHRAETAAVHRERMSWWSEALQPLAKLGKLVVPSIARGAQSNVSPTLLRFPVLVERGLRAKLLDRLSRFGMSASYPATLNRYPELAPQLLVGNIEGAASVAERVVTLPLHRYVTQSDVSRVTEEMEQI